MNSRTTETTVTFWHPFKLKSLDRPHPAGTYRLVIDEEEIPNISFLAYRRAATMLHTPAIATPGGSSQVFKISSEELAKALEADLRT
ncbi:hypothetical protein [Ancylobacter defluvii]|uniref:Uncharacterized protein n=1 Tax=Ancylobacter defluvii TaxID=1282440 RepID=A0A9W6JY41_9HYPH|nr:hypothetical protein [Ancylobacter defluvii]MBS7586064.1 hypothetical protein [Ancylobacter defluvii]GLK84449.1 hypothetical protein GCM10017653_25190 [Ancylobacter defluvii]